METKLKMILTHKDGERDLSLGADSINELIDKIKSWQDWDDNIDMLKQTKRYKANPKKVEKQEKTSGWYYFKKEG